MGFLRLHVDGQSFRDTQNREVILRGINVAGDAKCPKNPDVPSYEPKGFFEADNVSFVGRPFSIEDAHVQFKRLRKWGYNTIRYIFTWEAIEHAGPGIYDEEWIQFTIEILRIAKQYEFYVFMDPHQDVVCLNSQMTALCRANCVAVVTTIRRIGCADVDPICRWLRAEELQGYTGSSCSEYFRQPGEVPEDDLEHKLHPTGVSNDVHIVLGR